MANWKEIGVVLLAVAGIWLAARYVLSPAMNALALAVVGPDLARWFELVLIGLVVIICSTIFLVRRTRA